MGHSVKQRFVYSITLPSAFLYTFILALTYMCFLKLTNVADIISVKIHIIINKIQFMETTRI